MVESCPTIGEAKFDHLEKAASARSLHYKVTSFHSQLISYMWGDSLSLSEYPVPSHISPHGFSIHQ